MLYDIDNHKVITLHTRIKSAHEIRDAKFLIEKCCQLKCFLADKSYDAEWLHQYCFLIESGFSAIKRKYGSSVSGKNLASINTELSCKAIAHNLNLKY